MSIARSDRQEVEKPSQRFHGLGYPLANLEFNLVSKKSARTVTCGYLWRFYLQTEFFGELSKGFTWMPSQLYFTDLNLGEASSQAQSLELTMSPGFPAGPIGPGAPSDP